MLHIKRIYDEPGEEDGHRILVDRVWPRGISKEQLKGRLVAQRGGAQQRTPQVVQPRPGQMGGV